MQLSHQLSGAVLLKQQVGVEVSQKISPTLIRGFS